MASPSKSKPVIGIVGGVGAGKSAAAAEFAALGCRLVDGDATGHELLKEEEVRNLLRGEFGERIFASDGSVDRSALASVVFEDTRKLARLGEIMYPRIRERMERRISRAQCDAGVPAVVLDAAVLFEAGWDDLCTDTVFVSVPRRIRRLRACEARGWDARAWRRRENSQIPLDRKRRKCSHTLDNSSSLFHLREQVHKLFHRIVQGVGHP